MAFPNMPISASNLELVRAVLLYLILNNVLCLLEEFKRVEEFFVFWSAQGNFHCDINYCHETYCQMESYAAKFQNLAPLP